MKKTEFARLYDKFSYFEHKKSWVVKVTGSPEKRRTFGRDKCVLKQQSKKNMFSYKLYESAFVNLHVRNDSGQTLTSLLQEQQFPGEYLIELNTQEVNKGIYQIDFEVDNKSVFKKFVII